MQVEDSVGVLNAGKVGKLDYTGAFHSARLFYHTLNYHVTNEVRFILGFCN